MSFTFELFLTFFAMASLSVGYVSLSTFDISLSLRHTYLTIRPAINEQILDNIIFGT